MEQSRDLFFKRSYFVTHPLSYPCQRDKSDASAFHPLFLLVPFYWPDFYWEKESLDDFGFELDS